MSFTPRKAEGVYGQQQKVTYMDAIYTSVQLEMYTESMKVCLWALRNFKESGKVWWMASHGEAIQINLVRNFQVVLIMFLGLKGLKINKRENPSKR